MVKLTDEEKEQLQKDIEDGKVDIDDVYEKYGIPQPYMIDYKEAKEEDPNLTIEQYNKEVLKDKITLLFWQI